MNEKKDVEFNEIRGQEANYICDCCGETVREITTIDLPITDYYNKGKITTENKTLWFCDDCADKLIAALRVGR